MTTKTDKFRFKSRLNYYTLTAPYLLKNSEHIFFSLKQIIPFQEVLKYFVNDCALHAFI